MDTASRIARILGEPFDPGPPRAPRKLDAIVILGAPLRADDTLPPLAEERVRTGVELYRRGLADVICMAGGHCPRGYEHTIAEAEGMARWVRAAGVPESALRVDRLSGSTRENASRAAELLFPEDRRRVWIVTQRFHMRRALRCFRRVGFDPTPWIIEDGVQDAAGLLSVQWVVREYGSWVLDFAREWKASRK
ncbi:MAG: YdcF family protein [Polyangiaceae bacterium]